MDFERLIREKRDELIRLRPESGIDLILEHLKAAEKHFENGRKEKEEYLFCDVIYRTNQVFEGILKEAYEVLAGKSAKKLTPAKIEKYLTSNKVFSSLVIDYFSRYRTDWRNTSTHDHELRFNESEAFLAISTVVAFCYVALDQILQKLIAISFQNAGITSAVPKNKNSIENFVNELLSALKYVFDESNKHNFDSPRALNVYMNGAITGFCESYWSGKHKISYEPVIENDHLFFRPDIAIDAPELSVLMELTGFNTKSGDGIFLIQNTMERLDSMIFNSKYDFGVGIIFPNENLDSVSELSISKLENSDRTIYIVHPLEF